MLYHRFPPRLVSRWWLTRLEGALTQVLGVEADEPVADTLQFL